METIPFRILGLQVDKFQLNDSQIQRNETFDVKTEFKFGIDKVNQVVACRIDYSYMQQEVSLLEMSLVCFFNVQEDAFHRLFQGDKFVLQPYFSQYLAMINVGAARGEIHARCETAGSVMKNAILPPINLTESLGNPIVIDVN